jgi:hypothetical protein
MTRQALLETGRLGEVGAVAATSQGEQEPHSSPGAVCLERYVEFLGLEEVQWLAGTQNGPLSGLRKWPLGRQGGPQESVMYIHTIAVM